MDDHAVSGADFKVLGKTKLAATLRRRCVCQKPGLASRRTEPRERTWVVERASQPKTSVVASQVNVGFSRYVFVQSVVSWRVGKGRGWVRGVVAAR